MLEQEADAWSLSGTVAFLERGGSCGLAYEITGDSSWHTRTARVKGHIGKERVDLLIRAQNGSWSLSGETVMEVEGCLDIDLGFSPSTNLLPIRRLGIQVGQKVAVKAAWLKSPEISLGPLEQSYTRIADDRFRYESGGGSFTADLEVRDSGLVRSYADIWKEVSPKDGP